LQFNEVFFNPSDARAPNLVEEESETEEVDIPNQLAPNALPLQVDQSSDEGEICFWWLVPLMLYLI